jgi:hypothetical protein
METVDKREVLMTLDEFKEYNPPKGWKIKSFCGYEHTNLRNEPLGWKCHVSLERDHTAGI